MDVRVERWSFFPYLIVNHLLMPVVFLEHPNEFYDIRVLSSASKSNVYKERQVCTYVCVKLIPSPIETQY